MKGVCRNELATATVSPWADFAASITSDPLDRAASAVCLTVRDIAREVDSALGIGVRGGADNGKLSRYSGVAVR